MQILSTTVQLAFLYPIVELSEDKQETRQIFYFHTSQAGNLIFLPSGRVSVVKIFERTQWWYDLI